MWQSTRVLQYKLRDLSWFSFPVSVPPGATVNTSSLLNTIPEGVSLHRLDSPITKGDYYTAGSNAYGGSEDKMPVVVKKSE